MCLHSSNDILKKNCICDGHEHTGGFVCQASGIDKCGSEMVNWHCTCCLPIEKKLPSEIIHVSIMEKIRRSGKVAYPTGPIITSIFDFLDKYIGPVEVKDD